MNKKQFITAMIFSVLVSTPLTVLAAETNSQEGTELNPVTVTANKDKASDNQAAQDPGTRRLSIPESSKAATETFTRKDIEAMHPGNVFDIIGNAQGMLVGTQVSKGADYVRDRGGDTIGIILDGMYIPSSEATRMLSALPVDMIESVTIVRDSTVLTLGPLTALASPLSATNQGFIIINTRKAQKQEREVSVGYGSMSTEKFNFFTGDKVGSHYYDFGYTKARTSGKSGWNDASNSDSFLFKDGYANQNTAENIMLYINRGMRQFQRGIGVNSATDLLSAQNWKWAYDPLNTIIGSVNFDRFWDKKNTTELSLGYNSVRSDATNGSSVLWTGPENEYVREINVLHTLQSGNNNLEIGAQAIYWHSPTGVLNYSPYEREEELYGYYIQDEKRINDKLTLDGGIRLDKKHITKGMDLYFTTGGNGTMPINDQWANNATSATLGATYKLNPVYKLSTRISYSKQPTDSFLYTVNNKQLDPEERNKYEFGITANYNRYFNSALTAYYYDISNCKVAVNTSSVGPYTVNLYDAYNLTRKGLELSNYGQLSNTLSYKFGYTYFSSSNEKDSLTNPHNISFIALSYKEKNIDANLAIKHVGKFNYYASSSLSADVGDYTTIDANISKELDANTKITVYGRNLTNNNYTTSYRRVSGVGYVYYEDVGAVYGVEITKKF